MHATKWSMAFACTKRWRAHVGGAGMRMQMALAYMCKQRWHVDRWREHAVCTMAMPANAHVIYAFVSHRSHDVRLMVHHA
eukprot:93608-Chlamydomonas_euryale.AAC.4